MTAAASRQRAAERQRRYRERRRAEREAAAEAARRAVEQQGLRERIEQAAVEQLDQVERALAASGQALVPANASLVDRVLAGSRELLLRAYGNPLVRLATLAAADPVLLGRQLGCAPIEVLRLQQQADAELLDRLFGKAPQAVRMDGAPAVAVQIALTPGLADTLGLRQAEPKEIQGLAEEEPA